MANQDNGLVEIVRRIQLEEPILITSEVLDLYEGLSNLAFGNVKVYDGETRVMERDFFEQNQSRKENLRVLYARRLLSALLCEGFYKTNPVYATPLSFAVADYNRAGTNSKLYGKQQGMYNTVWLFRALTAYSRGSKLGYKKQGIGIDRDVFFISVKGAHAGLKLLKMERNGLDPSIINGWDHDRLVAVTLELLGFSNDISNLNVITNNPKILRKHQENLVDADELGLA